MVKYLEEDYEIDGPPQGFIAHFWTTTSAIGGWKGLLALFVILIVFYVIVDYVIARDRLKREAKQSKRK
jgi:hypothetical protein